VKEGKQDAAKGAELLLKATLLQQYCANESDEADSGSLEVIPDFQQSSIIRPHRSCKTNTGVH
jgi:hypothetical protein